MRQTTCLEITAGNLERIITCPLVREKGNTIVQQLADLLGHDRLDAFACSRIGEELARVCGKKQNKLKVKAVRVEGVLMRVAPVSAPRPKSPNPAVLPPALMGLQDEIEERQRRRKREEGDPQTPDQWERLMTSNRNHALNHPNPLLAASQ